MSLSLATLKLLQDAGVPAARLLEVAEAIERDFAKPPRSKGAERQARWRERKQGKEQVVTEVVTRDVSSDETETQQVTSSLQIPVQQEKLPPVDFDYGLSFASARDVREQAQRDLRNRSQELFEACRKRVNGSADFTRHKMLSVDPIIRLLAPISGEPCQWIADVAPAIETAAAQKHRDGGLIVSWDYVVPIAIRNRDQRLKPLPEPEKTHERTGQNQGGVRGRNANGGAGTGPRYQHGGNGLVAGLALLQSHAEAQDAVPDRPEDWRDDRVA